MYVIYRVGGLYEKQNCAFDLEYGSRPVLKTKGTVFSNADQPRLDFFFLKLGKRFIGDL